MSVNKSNRKLKEKLIDALDAAISERYLPFPVEGNPGIVYDQLLIQDYKSLGCISHAN